MRRFLVLLALEVGALGTCAATRAWAVPADPDAVLRSTDLLLAAVLWWVACLVTVWIATGTAALVAADLVPALRTMRLPTPVFVRHVVEGAVAVSMVAAASTPRVATAAEETPVVRTPAGVSTVSTTTPTTTGPTAPSPPTTTTEPVPVPVPAATDEEHVVVPGDNLWRIADAHLTATTGRPPTATEVLPYWRRVIDANRGRLRSGDPNLIFPGEVVVLPPVTA